MRESKKKSSLRLLKKTGAVLFMLFFIGGAVRAAIFTVNSTGDAADSDTANTDCETETPNECTLRAAIQQANMTAGIDNINFAVPGAGVHTITPASALPDITDAVIIDGYTQSGASVNTSVTTDNAMILIELNGANVPSGGDANGLRLVGSGSTVRGLAINRFALDGISLNGGDNNTISGNFIGTDTTGMIDFGNGSIGIEGEFGSNPNNNLIGGATPAARNIISGNAGSAIEFNFAGGNTIQGNFIGLAADGATAMGNGGAGIGAGSFTGGTLIGGDDAADGTTDGIVGARNYISGNIGAGIFAGGAAFSGVSIMGNYIGTDTTGTLARGNSDGIATNIATGAVIGGSTAGAGNLISGNTNNGISLGNTGLVTVRGNQIGTAANGVSPLGNTGNGVQIVTGGGTNSIGGAGAGEGNIIAFNSGDGVYVDSFLNPASNSILSNSIFSNGGLGIDLGTDGVTPNDAGDADSGGGNNLQNFPVITVAQPGSTRVVGTFNSTASTTFRLEFFNTPAADASGSGEGQLFIGAVNVTTDGGGNAMFDQTFAANSPMNSFVSATATNLMTGDTSEFSNARLVAPPTAASVSISGRVILPQHFGLTNAFVTLTNSQGSSRTVLTGKFGSFRFTDVQAGETYILSVISKRYTYAPQMITVTGDIVGLSFIAQ